MLIGVKMLSDDSSSDSETGRFKGSSGKRDNDRNQKSYHRENKTSRYSGDQKHGQDIDRKGESHRSSRLSPYKHRSSRHSPSRRRHRSHDKSTHREPKRPSDRHRGDNYTHERHCHDRRRSPDHGMHSRGRPLHRHSNRRSYSKEDTRESHSKFKTSSSREASKSRIERSVSYERKSNEFKSNRSAIHRPSPSIQKRDVPRSVEIMENEDDESDVIQPASYYNSLPTVKEDIDSTEVDSSDEETLRAKLLHLEKELVKNKKKKHRKKHKKSLKSKHREKDSSTVEVTSTTDIDKNMISDDVYIVESDTPEVSSTQTKPQKNESSEEGEITSDVDHPHTDDKANEVKNIDLEDLRHKLNRDKVKEVCGPALPPHLSERSNKSSSPELEGPALPPHLRNKQRSMGPSISSDLRQVLANNKVAEYSESDEDDGIGPIPVGSVKLSDAHRKLEERALDIKINKLDGHNKDGRDKYKREVWMTELPEAKAKYLGLEARQFRAKEGPDMSDRSSWTDTPEDKARKAKGLTARDEDKNAILIEETRSKFIADRDAEQEHVVKKHKKKHNRDESLLDIHQKKLKKKKKKEEDNERKERRPFNRDTDLQVNRFDEAQKKSIIKKAQHLDTRFSSGEAKYL